MSFSSAALRSLCLFALTVLCIGSWLFRVVLTSD
jgi:hypothetical protein